MPVCTSTRPSLSKSVRKLLVPAALNWRSVPPAALWKRDGSADSCRRNSYWSETR